MKYTIYARVANDLDIKKASISTQNKLFDNSMNFGLFAWLSEMEATYTSLHLKTAYYNETQENTLNHSNKPGDFL